MKELHSICEQIWKTQQWPKDWKRSVFIPIPKKGNAKECSNYRTIALISHTSKVMLKILQARLQQYRSVQFSHSVVSNSLWSHESQHTRPPCTSLSPRVHSDSRPSSQWCHPAISSLVVPFSSCPQSVPASGSFPMSQLLNHEKGMNLSQI